MSNLDDKRAAAKSKADQHRKDQERLCQLAAEVARTDAGKEIITHLWKRFDVEGRAFIAGPDGSVCPHRAAIRDGERAAVSYLVTLIRKANPEFQPDA